MAGVNKVILIGYIGKDLALRYTQGGTPVLNFTFATTEKTGDGQGGTKDLTEWHNIVAWSQHAVNIEKYCRKGSHLFILGRLQTTDWIDPQGTKHYKTEIVVREFQFLDKKGETPYQPYNQEQSKYQQPEQASDSGLDDYDIGDLGPPLDMDGDLGTSDKAFK